MRRLQACAAAALASSLLGCSAGVPRRAVLEAGDMRAYDSADLRRASSSGPASLRREAVRAMGRVQSPKYAGAVIAALSDRDAGVRAEAAFALGQLALAAGGDSAPSEADRALHKRAAGALLSLTGRGPLPVRLAAIEALGKTGPEVEELLGRALRVPEPELRGEAALALFRLRFLKRVPEYSSATARALIVALSDPVPSVRWRAAYAFSRFPEPRAATLLAQVLDGDSEPWARYFAARALGQLKEQAPWEELVRALRQADPLLRLEAVRALGAARRAAYFPDQIFKDPSPHVRAAAADALRETGDPKLAYRLDDVDADSSPLARGQVLLAEPVLRPKAAAETLAEARVSPHWWVRSRAYLATGDLPGQQRALVPGLGDPDSRVAAAAAEGLSKASRAAFERWAIGAMNSPATPIEMMGAAVEGAGRLASPALLPALVRAHDSPQARAFPELLDDIRQAVKAISEEQEKQARAEGRPFAGTDLVRLPLLAMGVSRPSRFLDSVPPRGAVVLETEKGEVEIELAVDEAPVHAAAFLDSAQKGFYDGLTWHRVASGFVVQGGDPRGSGWGGAGFTLRDEISRLRFDRGTVGMPKSARKDTGSGQLFITHVPTPHLDGRYTAFGRVVRGMEAVDLLEPGDRILRARVKP